MLAARYAVEAHTFHGGMFFERCRIAFTIFRRPHGGGLTPKALTYLWVLVIVTFIAEATGTIRIIFADHPCQKQRIDTRSLINLHLMSCLLIIVRIAVNTKVLDDQAILRQPEVAIMDANFPSIDYG